MEQELLPHDDEVLTRGRGKSTEQLKKRLSAEFVPMCRDVGNEEVDAKLMRTLEEIAANFPTPPSHVPQHRSLTNEQTQTTSTYSTAMKATSSYFGAFRQAMTDRVSGIAMAKK